MRSASRTWTPTSAPPATRWSVASTCVVTWCGLFWTTSSGPRVTRSGSASCSWSTARSGASPSRAPAGTLRSSGATACSSKNPGKDGALEYRNLGQTGMRVSEISLGTWALGGEWGAVAEDDAYAALNRAVDLGVNFLDTADVYGDGRSEKLIGRLLKDRPQDEVSVATKAGRRLDPHAAEGYNYDNLSAFV